MTRDQTTAMIILSLCNAFVFWLGNVMLGFATALPESSATEPASHWPLVAIPVMAVICPLIGWAAPWPFTTIARRVLIMFAPFLCVAIGLLTLFAN